ncbi:CRISPR system precrRNA processing endoribonuclease RAMP protein Cas6 [candidate division KSB1 bacterium]|nr:CRISPR system precrRNA processing endoribonuclease RAMP protein Cas6 [candidate division KSB1 bacterium]
MTLDVAKFGFVFTALEPILFPSFKGSTIRGSFGHSFKKIVCVRVDKDCKSCHLQQTCLYSYIFDTPVTQVNGLLQSVSNAPHPFVFEPDIITKNFYQAGEQFEIDVILIGRSIQYVPYFIYGFDLLAGKGLGKGRGTAQLDVVLCRNCNETVYQSTQKIVTKKWQTLEFEFDDITDQCSEIELEFLTPTRIKFKNSLTDQLDFTLFFTNLIRRISILIQFHQVKKNFNFDHAALIEASRSVDVSNSRLKWFDWERYSTRQNTRMKLGGLTGTVKFKGDLGPFIPFLRAGEYIHVGKGTSFGLGKYKITSSH